MYNASLVLEGGGMRGVYTCGVLDFFLDKNIEFDCVAGVSAGACSACSYLSKQKFYGYKQMTDYLNDDRYMSIHNYLRSGNVFGTDFIFDIVPNELMNFDYKVFSNYTGRFYAVATDIETGEPVYHPITNLKIGADTDYVKASMSLPLLANLVEVDGRKLLDGGIADSIPVKKMREIGYDKCVVIQTQYHDYWKEKNKLMPVLSRSYKNYPRLIERMGNRHIDYNNTLDYINEMKEQGKCFVIQPKEQVTISRLEKNPEKLRALYDSGYHDAQAAYDDLIAFLNK